ncbi:MAG: transcriptional regulator [Halobacteriota archaeon]
MTREALVDNITAMLRDAGYVVSDRCAIRPKSFDVVARRDDTIIFLKILGNIDAFEASTGLEMRRLADLLGGTAMVIGLRSRDEDLKPSVVYFRHGVPVISPDTAFDLFIEEVDPLIYAAPGGLYVTIDSDILEDKRRERGWSLGQLASELGVSRRTVSKYEDGMNASIDVAMALEELFDAPLTNPISLFDEDELVEGRQQPFDQGEDEADEVGTVALLTHAGFTAHPIARAPFRAIGEDEDTERGVVLTGQSVYNRTAKKRARIMGSIGEVTGSQSVYIVERAREDAIHGTAIVERGEVEDIDESDDLRDMIRTRAKGSSR